MNPVPLLQARDLTYRAGTRALVDGVSLTLAPGEVLAVVGPNGAGKSTLLKLLAGDLTPTAGEVCLDGRRLAAYGARELALRRAVLPQQTVLQFAFTARAVVAMGRSPHYRTTAFGSPDDAAIVEDAMERTDTTVLAGRVFPSLSGGEQQRVTFARVLAQAAPLLLLDEPTTALDIRHQHLTMATARRLADDGAAVLAVLHDLNLAAESADTIALLHAGRLAALGPPAQVLTDRLLSEVYDHPITVFSHPLHGGPLVVPQGRFTACSSP